MVHPQLIYRSKLWPREFATDQAVVQISLTKPISRKARKGPKNRLKKKTASLEPLKLNTALTNNFEKFLQCTLVQIYPFSESSYQSSPAEPTTSSTSEVVDCRKERRRALEASRVGNHDAYVAECDKGGKFKVVQCYKVRSPFTLYLGIHENSKVVLFKYLLLLFNLSV